MNALLYYPNAGRMPALDALPASLHSSIEKLSALPCVQGVVTGLDPYLNKIVFFVAFADGHRAQFRQTLNCFTGFHAEYFNHRMDDHCLHVVLKETFLA